MRIQQWWHNIARTHVMSMSKPGIGDMLWCSNRFTGDNGLHIAPDDGSGDVLYLTDATMHDLANLAMAVSATDLRNRVGHASVCVECCV